MFGLTKYHEFMTAILPIVADAETGRARRSSVS
jgi:hypothetical protein